MDASVNVYIADTRNNKIRKITPDGNVTTLAGYGGNATAFHADGQGKDAVFNQPRSLALDSDGNVIVGERRRIRRVTAAGNVSTLAGSGEFGNQNGWGTSSSFGNEIGVAVDLNGNVYVTYSWNNQIRKVTLPW